MDELVNALAELQEEQAKENAKADEASAETDAAILNAKRIRAALEGERACERQPHEDAAKALQVRIDNIKATIIDEWGGKKKTYTYPEGILSFRTTTSLNIIDEARLLEILINTVPVADIAAKYIKGFNLTGVKQFVDVANVPTGVVKLESKTTVKLKTE